MDPPFSRAEFFQILADYNTAVWPTQAVLAVLALGAVAAAFRQRSLAHRGVTAVLGLLWLWMAVGYHWAWFTRINGAAWAFGGFFLLQGLAFLFVAMRSPTLRYEPRWDVFGVTGAAFMGYALVLYPMVGAALGHTYPAQPTFGLPCPTTILTLGILLWARPRVHPTLLVVPVLWSLVGMNAAYLFGVLEDWALPVAGLLGGGLVLMKNRRAGPAEGG